MTVSESNSGEYEVGFKRTPLHTRFRKGESGNRNGRPKNTKNLKTDLNEELREKVTLKDGDRTRRISKQRAIVKTLVNKTLKGDTRAAATLINLVCRTSDLGASEVLDIEPLTKDELEVLAEFEKGVVRKHSLNAVSAEDQSGGINS
jgi:hypothetical protein